jgi:HK97 family phage prohead protease/HK97 family phage major capsid protein
MKKDKVLYLTQQFTKDTTPMLSDTIDSINIEGYANTTQVDRVGDVIPMTAWNDALVNYLKNPIILAYHEDDQPIGRMVDHRIDAQGFWVKARISAAAEDVFNLVKDGVLTAFSVGFTIKDAMYDAVTDLFIIKQLELLEISVVSIPCNQDSTFSLSKAFDSAEDYSNFKSQFATKEESAKGLELPEAKQLDTITKEWNMDPKELEQMLAKAATEAATKATEAILAKQVAQKEAEVKAAAEDAALTSKIASVIKSTDSGAERLLADIEKRFADQTEASKNVLAGLEASIKEKATELETIQKSKMSFADKGAETCSYDEREKSVMLAKIMNKSIDQTKFGAATIQKAGTHMASATWELEVSTNMEAEIRRRLVVAPLIRSISMNTNVMTIPVNPEAGVATWMANTSFGTTASAGTTQTHQLKEITLNAYKVATAEYLAYEEEEDTLLILLPIVRDAMVRRVARAVDKAYLVGAGSGADPVKGLGIYDATSVVVPTNTGVCTIANLRAMRKDLGYWGLDPAEVVYVVSTDVYYDLLDDTTFQTMNQVGPQATLLTGQVGQVGNSPVLVSDSFGSKAGGTSSATTNIGAICLAAGNFLSGNQRGLRFDTQDLVETQRKVLVASLRTGMTQLSTVNGMGVSTLRWS